MCIPSIFQLKQFSQFFSQAHSAYRGIGIVKLMGRSSGFIAMQASLASGQVDICLIPEVLINGYIIECLLIILATDIV